MQYAWKTAAFERMSKPSKLEYSEWKLVETGNQHLQSSFTLSALMTEYIMLQRGNEEWGHCLLSSFFVDSHAPFILQILTVIENTV